MAAVNKPVILVFNQFYYPGFKAGGPVRTIVNMVDRLGDDFDFRIVTQDRDLGDDTHYNNVELNDWTTVGKGRVRYLYAKAFTLSTIAGIVREVQPDAIYLNSFFDPMFTQKVLLARLLRRFPATPVILAPRGEFSEGALGLKSIKKKMYLWITRLLGLYRNITWQASSDLEAKDIRTGFPPSRSDHIQVALNLAPAVSAGEGPSHHREPGAPLRVCFISRISPKKNLDYALRVLQTVKVPVLFTVYGPRSEPEYWQTCETLISALPAHIHVSWGGELKPVDVNARLTGHDLFFFPTRGENYGHVIYEALAAGLPVLLSDQTPWTDLETQGIGWSLPLAEPSAFADIIEQVALWSEEKLDQVSVAAREHARSVAKDDAVLEDNRRLFHEAVGRS